MRLLLLVPEHSFSPRRLVQSVVIGGVVGILALASFRFFQWVWSEICVDWQKHGSSFVLRGLERDFENIERALRIFGWDRFAGPAEFLIAGVVGGVVGTMLYIFVRKRRIQLGGFESPIAEQE